MNLPSTRVWCNGSKFDWPMKDMSINQKVGGRNIEEEFGQALFFVSPTPHYVPRETKIEPDRRLSLPSNKTWESLSLFLMYA